MFYATLLIFFQIFLTLIEYFQNLGQVNMACCKKAWYNNLKLIGGAVMNKALKVFFKNYPVTAYIVLTCGIT